MQYTYATSAYHEARFLVHFHLAILANFEQGVLLKMIYVSSKSIPILLHEMAFQLL